MEKREFLKMVATIDPAHLAIADREGTIVALRGMSPAQVWDMYQTAPETRILASSVDDSFALVDKMDDQSEPNLDPQELALIPIQCVDRETTNRVRGFLRYTFGAGAYVLADGTLLYKASRAEKATVVRLTELLKILFGGVGVYDETRDAYTDITCGPAVDGVQHMDTLGTAEVTDYVERYSTAVETKPAPAAWNSYDPDSFDLGEWLTHVKVPFEKEDNDGLLGMAKYRTPYGTLIHSLTKGGIFLAPINSKTYVQTWEQLCRRYDPAQAADAKREEAAHMRNAENPAQGMQEKKEEDKGEDFESIVEVFRQAEQETESERVYKTGLLDFDAGWGLRSGTVTLISGYPGNGKSTLVSQMVLNLIADGCRIGYYNGELSKHHFTQWIAQQAAGADHISKSQTAVLSGIVDPDTKAKIVCWLNGRMWVYNKQKLGNNHKTLTNKIRETVKEHAMDVVVVDNLMTLEANFEKDENEMQHHLVAELANIATELQVAVILVAHPKKTVKVAGYFLEMTDILGTSKIPGLVSTIMYVYKINDAFDQAFKARYQRDRVTDDELGDAQACYNIVKGRITNPYLNLREDTLRPLYFNPMTKRLLSRKDQTMVLPWQEIPEEEAKAMREYLGIKDAKPHQLTAEEQEVLERERARESGRIKAVEEKRERKEEKQEGKKADYAQKRDAERMDALLEEQQRQPKKYALNIF